VKRYLQRVTTVGATGLRHANQQAGNYWARASGLHAMTYIIRQPADQAVAYDSNSLFKMPDCRIMDCSVPIHSSEWLGTGTVIVVSESCFCITIWLPRFRTSTNP
jgi:hypothetical protein